MYAYMTGLEQPTDGLSIAKERRIGGHAIGILRLDCLIPLLPGDVSNANTYKFPVLYKIAEGVTEEQLFKGEPSVGERLIKAGKELEKQGVRAISSSCGYFGYYQKEVAAALDIPVFLSSLLQIPLISRALRPGQKVGIICANSATFSPNLTSACGVNDWSIIKVVGFEDLRKSEDMALTFPDKFNSHKFEEELVSLVRRFVNNNHDIGAILFECANLPPYAWSVQKAVGLPVFDFVTMINWAYNAVVRHPFAGFI